MKELIESLIKNAVDRQSLAHKVQDITAKHFHAGEIFAYKVVLQLLPQPTAH